MLLRATSRTRRNRSDGSTTVIFVVYDALHGLCDVPRIVDPQSWSKTKHVMRHHHFLRECVEDGRMRVEFVRSEHNLSDIFTKSLEAKQFKLLRAALMNLPLESLQ